MQSNGLGFEPARARIGAALSGSPLRALARSNESKTNLVCVRLRFRLLSVSAPRPPAYGGGHRKGRLRIAAISCQHHSGWGGNWACLALRFSNEVRRCAFWGWEARGRTAQESASRPFGFESDALRLCDQPSWAGLPSSESAGLVGLPETAAVRYCVL